MNAAEPKLLLPVTPRTSVLVAGLPFASHVLTVAPGIRTLHRDFTESVRRGRDRQSLGIAHRREVVQRVVTEDGEPDFGLVVCWSRSSASLTSRCSD
jgi:hypothetical protein